MVFITSTESKLGKLFCSPWSFSQTFFTSLQKILAENHSPREAAFRKDCVWWLAARHIACFPIDSGGINLGHTRFEINTAHRCIETQRQKAKLGKFHLFLFLGRNKRAEWSLETGSFCDFSVWLNLKWCVTGPRSLRADEKLTVHCYRTELNSISGKRLGNLLIEEAWSAAYSP